MTPRSDRDSGASHPRIKGVWAVVALGAVIVGVAVALTVFQSRPPIPLGLLRSDPSGPARPPKLPPLWEHFGALTVVEQLTGPGSPNRTYERWNVGGTDLGHTFFHEGDLYMVFGDTYGRERGDWRSNTMAKIAGIDSPAEQFAIESFITDAEGRAKELLSSEKVYWVERTVIPTNGISVDDTMFLHYMSVRRWLGPGRWRINHAGIARSPDDGQTWFKTDDIWGEDTNFAQVAFVRNGADPGWVYLFGIPAGRFGSVKLARVGEDRLTEARAYEYWDGQAWARSERRAIVVVPGPVGELSVAWSGYLQRWLMMYLDERVKGIVIRTAEHLTGPWTDERLITTSRDHPQLYAPFIIPFDSNEPEIYFTMSRWDSYNVFLMHLRLD